MKDYLIIALGIIVALGLAIAFGRDVRDDALVERERTLNAEEAITTAKEVAGDLPPTKSWVVRHIIRVAGGSMTLVVVRPDDSSEYLWIDSTHRFYQEFEKLQENQEVKFVYVDNQAHPWVSNIYPGSYLIPYGPAAHEYLHSLGATH